MFFSARGGGRGVRGAGGGIGFLLKISGGGISRRGRGRWGREGICGELGNFGGALNIFFGAETSTKKASRLEKGLLEKGSFQKIPF